MNNSLVYAHLPRAGLGNKMLIWAKAKIFSYINNIPLITTGWSEIKIGPLLRRERVKRFYHGYFRPQNPLRVLNLIYAYAFYERSIEPKLEKTNSARTILYIFRNNPYPDYFKDIRDFRDFIRNELFTAVSKSILIKTKQSQVPIIGVHIRRSDFTNDIRTPNKYFIDSIKYVRKIYGKDIPVTIFSDAFPEELRDIFALGNITISLSKNALHDIILLSKSRCLILSKESTFGYWAGFLSDAPIILPTSLDFSIRSSNFNNYYYEGLAQEDKLLIKNIKDIQL